MDHSLWDAFLKKYVNESGEMNFAAAARDRSLLDQYLQKASQAGNLDTMDLPREEFLAFWLNLYHAVLVKTILNHYPLKSILDIPGVWEAEAFKMGDQKYSLNQIRSDKLLGAYRDEKINAVLACTAKSCPGFQREAYTGPKVEGQLYLQARQFVNNPRFNEITPGKKQILLSRIFKWYATDFTLDYGQFENDRGLRPEEFAVLSFVANSIEDPAKKDYLEQGNYKIKYLPFDWTLADAK